MPGVAGNVQRLSIAQEVVPLVAPDYIAWIKDVLRRKPHLSQAGLARQIGRDKSAVNLMLAGKRQIKAAEIEQIAIYLGEPPPGRTAPASEFVPIVGRLGPAWYEPGQMPAVHGVVAPVLARRDVRQIAYLLDSPAAGLPQGATIIAYEIDRSHKPDLGQMVVVQRERGGLVGTTLARMGTPDVKDGTPIAIVIEVRWSPA